MRYLPCQVTWLSNISWASYSIWTCSNTLLPTNRISFKSTKLHPLLLLEHLKGYVSLNSLWGKVWNKFHYNSYNTSLLQLHVGSREVRGLWKSVVATFWHQSLPMKLFTAAYPVLQPAKVHSLKDLTLPLLLSANNMQHLNSRQY